ncbi:MAG: hypothetical protein EOO77_19785 [Oxalobacteraceae bacterium]|nr:MAG: hypothetical protein EOO77_19785 [Oxalobacteraceae bacterium]
MNSESQLAIELWDVIRDQIQPARRLETAISFMRAFEDFGMEARDLQDVLDEDVYLTRAYREVYEVEEDQQHEGGGEE